MTSLANPLRVYFWMLGQDARLGLLTQGGFERMGPSIYRRGALWLHQLGLSLPDEGLSYQRPDGRFYRQPTGTPLPFAPAWQMLRPHLQEYEEWVCCARPNYRKKLLRICPPALRPLRRKWCEAFS